MRRIHDPDCLTQVFCRIFRHTDSPSRVCARCSIQRDLESGSDNTFHPKDPYLARILEILDAVRSHLA